MLNRQVMYTFDGDTFVGTYFTTSHAGVQSVAVQFNGRTISARIGGLSEERVARVLLGELVRERFAENLARGASTPRIRRGNDRQLQPSLS